MEAAQKLGKRPAPRVFPTRPHGGCWGQGFKCHVWTALWTCVMTSCPRTRALLPSDSAPCFSSPRACRAALHAAPHTQMCGARLMVVRPRKGAGVVKVRTGQREGGLVCPSSLWSPCCGGGGTLDRTVDACSLSPPFLPAPSPGKHPEPGVSELKNSSTMGGQLLLKRNNTSILCFTRSFPFPGGIKGAY